MSQIRKLLQGSQIPKFQKGNKFYKNGLYVGEGEELYKQLANYLTTHADADTRPFVNDFLYQYSKGEYTPHTNGNYSNYVPTDEDEGWTEDGTKVGKTAGAVFNTKKHNYYRFNALLNGFNYVAPKKEAETPKTKSAFDTSAITLNYNDDPNKKGHRIWSTGSADNQRAIQRVTDALAGLKDPDNSDYTFDDTLKAAYQIAVNSGMTPEEYAQAIWDRLRDNNWTGYKNPENDNDLDWLKALGIGIGPYEAPASSAPASAASSASTATEGNLEQTPPQIQNHENETPAGEGEGQVVQPKPIETAVSTPTYRIEYKLEQSAPDSEGWVTYTIPSVGEYQYNINNNIATGRPGDQARAERKADKELSFIAKPVSETPLVYNGINYPIVREKDTDNYYALQDNMRIKLDQDFVTKWLEGKLAEQDYAKLQSRTGKYTQFVDSNGERVNWLVNFFKNVWAGAKTGVEQYKDNLEKNKPKETREEFKARREQEKKSRQYAAGKERKKNGGKVDVFTAKYGTKITKAQDGLALYRDALRKDGVSEEDFWTFLNSEGFKPDSRTPEQVSGDLWLYHKWRAENGWNPDYINDLTSVASKNAYKADNSLFGEQKIYDPEVEETLPIGIKSIAEQQTGNVGASNLNATTKGSTDFNEIAPETKGGGDPVNPYPFLADLGNGIFDTTRFIGTALGSKMKRDEIIRNAKNNIIKPATPTFHGMSTDTPVEDAQLNYLQSLVGNVNHANISDSAVVNALNNYDWSNLLPQLNQVYRQKAQRAKETETYNIGVHDKQSQVDAEAENNLRAQQRAANQIVSDAKQAHITEFTTSLQNMNLQEQTKYNKALDLYNQYGKNQAMSDAMTQYQKGIDNLFIKYKVEEAYKVADDASKYLDMEDWYNRSPNAKKYRDAMKVELEGLSQTRDTAFSKAAVDYGIPYRYRWLADYYKSGGTISTKTRNRYKNEPWEDIWINSNKSAHAAVAKLNDNIIRIFLKTLK